MRPRTAWIALAVAVPVMLAGGAWLAIDPNAYKPQIEAAVQRSTGRALTLAGGLHVRLTPALTLVADQVSYANPPGFSRPEMLSAAQLRAELAVLPLLHGQLQIKRLDLVHADLLLERNAAGVGNWLTDPGAPRAVVGAPGGTPAPAPRSATELRALHIEDSLVTWRDARLQHPVAITVNRLDASEATTNAPISLAMDGARNGTGFSLSGTSGSLDRVQDRTATTAWPLNVTLKSGAATLSIEGSLTSPLTAQGYRADLRATVPDLAALAPLMPEWTIPALHDVQMAARIADGQPFPTVSALTLHTGAGDLGSVAPGLLLNHVDIAAPDPAQPVQATIEGSLAGNRIALKAMLGPPAALLPGGADAPFPVDIAADIAGGTITAKGSLAHPATRSGLDIAVAAQLPNLAALGPLVGKRLPDLGHLALSARLQDAASGLAVRQLKVTSAPAEFSGDVVLGWLPRPSLTGALTASHIDLDAIRAAVARTPAAPEAATTPEPSKSHRLFPETDLPFQRLTLADAELDLQVGAFEDGGVHYSDLAGHIALQDGHLRISRATANLPGGRMEMTLDIDASRRPPREGLVLHAPGLALKPMLTDFGLPDDASGVLEVDADLHGVGATPHAIAESLNGHLGLAMINGTLDNRLIIQLVGPVLKAVKLPISIPPNGGHSQIRCFAARLDASQGIAAARSLLLDVTRFRITAAGTIDLGDETLAARLRPYVQLAGSGVVVPLLLNGPILSPKVSLSPTGPAESVASLAASLLVKGSRLTPVTSALASAGEQLLGDADSGDCAPALLLARNGVAGPQPPPPKRETGNPVGDLLKGLFK